jgi:hypothetical protein
VGIKILQDMKYKPIILSFFLICQTLLTFPQSGNLPVEEKTLPEILIGKIQRIDLQKGEFSQYFFKEYRCYFPNKEITDQIKDRIYNQSITIVLGTWCHDSKEQVPRFIKILDVVDYNTNLLEIICVDRNKSAGQTDISGLDIKRVPTFIISENGKEKGRIIETPLLTIEEDIYNLLFEKQ